MPCDVTDPAQVEAAFAAVEEHWGPVEVLVANAGITRDALVLRMDEDAWYRGHRHQPDRHFRVAKRAVAKMLRLHRGRIIFISSVGAFVGLPGQANYAASKAGLVGMARALAREVAQPPDHRQRGGPGVVATDMIAALGEDRVAPDGRPGPARAGPAAAERRGRRRSASWPRTGARPTSPARCCRSTAVLGMGL